MPPQFDFSHFVEWGFMALIAGSVGYSAKFLNDIRNSIAKLNTQVALLLQASGYLEQRLVKLEKSLQHFDQRLDDVEKRRR